MFERRLLKINGVRMAMVFVVVLFARGCQPPTDAAGLLAPEPAVERPVVSDADQQDVDEQYVLLVRLHIVAIEVPVGQASLSRDLWRHIDEEAVRALRNPLLGLNGVRAGLGRADTWPDVAEVLKALTGRRLSESAAVVLPGNPMPIALKIEQPRETLFVFDIERRPVGLDYPAGDHLLTVVCTLNEDDPSQVLMQAIPQVRSSKRTTHFREQEGRLMMVAEPDLITLDSLAVQAMVPAGDFLVFGPGMASDRTSSVGHAFFIKERKGMEFETLVVLRPEVFATTVRTPNPAGAIR